jgi:lipopolysaccharide/colanic/teichoic acid biosynthesis glycosyltransferase
MFTELGSEEQSATISTIFTRVSSMLQDRLTAEQSDGLSISFHVFPEEWDSQNPERPSNPTLYPDLDKREDAQAGRRIVKRTMDILVSLLVLTLGSPVFLLIAVAIKLTSRGPVFYRQRRVGQYGKSFSFLKFRSMYDGNDSTVHKEYVRQMIAGIAPKNPGKGNGKAVYKLTEDSRITPVGTFLRRFSLDELPQFINVLKGDMSLVGPRPPIDYEVERYDLWHRRRVLEAKPGLTGLWQVNGRNRIAFDEMVRLDLRYVKSWSPWLDLTILLRTPKAMLEGAH